MPLLRATFDLVQLCAKRVGIAISHDPPPNSYKRQLCDFLEKMKINVVLDVGAFIGDYAAFLRETGYQGLIISFEPVPASYARLYARLHGDSLWRGQPYGLSEENREASMNTYSWGAFNSLLNLRKDAELTFSLDPALQSQEPVQLKRLDSVLSQLVSGIEAPRIFMKMDTQGHDVSVLAGADGVLNEIVGLQSELPAVNVYDGMTSMASALEYYASRGFLPIGFYRENMFNDIQITAEFNVLFNRFDGSLYQPQSSF